ncbi:MAG: phosphoribosylglycinamide formyltransferase [Burkholderiales bacterium]
MKRVAILISGRGSNMKAILDAGLAARFFVLTNNPAASGLETAKQCGAQTAVIDHRQFPDRAGFDTALARQIQDFAPDLVVLAGFMRILTDTFVHQFSGRIINIHPSLLPAFPGTDTHRRALAEGVKLHGCTVHFVTSDLDRGPVIAQAAVPVLADDDEHALAARVLEQEHRLFPAAVGWFLDGRLRLDGRRVTLNAIGAPPAPLLYPEPR